VRQRLTSGSFRVEIAAIGGIDLPEDLVAPFYECCGTRVGEVWFASIEDVARAAVGAGPLVSPCCGRRYGISELGEVSFFSRAAWEASGDDDEAPQVYHVGSAFAS
jgi:hypothetical protein